MEWAILDYLAGLQKRVVAAVRKRRDLRPPHLWGGEPGVFIKTYVVARDELGIGTGSAEFKVFHFLALHIDENGQCWPGEARLAELTGLARQTVSRAIQTLTHKDLIRVKRRFGTSSVYTVNPRYYGFGRDNDNK